MCWPEADPDPVQGVAGFEGPAGLVSAALLVLDLVVTPVSVQTSGLPKVGADPAWSPWPALQPSL